MQFIGLARATVVAFVTLTVVARSACHAAPTAPELAQAGAVTLKRLADGGAAHWKAKHATSRGIVFEVEIFQARDKRRTDVVAIIGTERERLVRIIERDGLWYVTEPDVQAKYFPYEAPLKLPAFYLYFSRSDLQVMTDENFGKITSVDGDLVTCHVPLPPELRTMLQQAVTEMKKFPATDGDQRQELAARMATAQRQLDEGNVLKIDASTGIVVQAGEEGRRVQITDFAWVDQPDEAEFAVDQATWQDETTPLAPVGSNDLAMIGYAAFWRPGQPTSDTDAMLVNLRTGKFRRVPTPYAAPMAGCFSPDRTKAYVSAADWASGAIAVGEIDLVKHSFRPLGGKAAVGFNMFPCVSPSGKSLVWLHKSGNEPGVLNSRICLLDLRSNTFSFVGEPMDTSFLSWLPDASAIILVHRDSTGPPDKPPLTSIARLTSSGKVSIIRPGNYPQVIPATKRILFEDRDELWKTCAFDGKDEQLVGDGLKSFGFPSISPDGTRVLMNKFDPATGPRPHVVDLKTGRAREISLPAGLWVQPAWR